MMFIQTASSQATARSPSAQDATTDVAVLKAGVSSTHVRPRLNGRLLVGTETGETLTVSVLRHRWLGTIPAMAGESSDLVQWSLAPGRGHATPS